MICSQPAKTYEQVSVDYFFKTIWKSEYKDYKKIEFAQKTDTTLYSGNVYGCKEWGKEQKEVVRTFHPHEVIALTTESRAARRFSGSNRLKLFVGPSIPMGENYVVQLDVYKPKQFVDHYFIEFDDSGNIIDQCKVGEII